MSLFENPSFDGHESVHVLHDPSAGMNAIVAVHSTARGPSAGGTRFWRYADSDAALTDVLRLSKAMSYKNAMADLPLGGGKAVLMKPDGPFDRTALFETYGRALDRLGGVYITAEDVGVTPEDMAAIARGTRHVAGLPAGTGASASGDPSPVTARGVFECLKASVRRARGGGDLAGVTVAVQGVGHVGAHLCGLLHGAGARLAVADVDADAAAEMARRFDAKVVEPDAIYDEEAFVFAPCALGGSINDETLGRLTCRVVAGGANNQLARPDLGEALRARGVLYAPDYVVNAGGIINIASEVSGRYDPDWVAAKVERLAATLEEIFARADADGRATNLVADEIARERIAAGAG
ncbi:MAG: amino acid dehydrogenase [Caulobacterales bacterium]|nr:amino acid dehydrogenase [Caulobacterales bacterium]